MDQNTSRTQTLQAQHLSWSHLQCFPPCIWNQHVRALQAHWVASSFQQLGRLRHTVHGSCKVAGMIPSLRRKQSGSHRLQSPDQSAALDQDQCMAQALTRMPALYLLRFFGILFNGTKRFSAADMLFWSFLVGVHLLKKQPVVGHPPATGAVSGMHAGQHPDKLSVWTHQHQCFCGDIPLVFDWKYPGMRVLSCVQFLCSTAWLTIMIGCA